MRRISTLCVTLCIMCIVSVLPATAARAHLVPSGVNDGRLQRGASAATNAQFPRIGNFNGYGNTSRLSLPVTSLWSRYQLTLMMDSLTWNSPSTLTTLRQSAPDQTILAYDRTYAIDYTQLDRYGDNAIYPGWWLTKAGSSLAAAIDASQTTIPVTDPSLFARYDDVLVDGETMHVTAINTAAKTLTVQRGFYSSAAAHSNGTRIASHAYPPLSSTPPSNANPGDASSRRPWALNASILCPRNAQGQRWVDYLASWSVSTVLANPNWSGMFFDNTNDKLYDATIDVNNDNVADKGIVTYNGQPYTNVWKLGFDSLFAQVRAKAPDALILGTGPYFTNISDVNGQNFNMPTIEDDLKYQYLMTNYQYRMDASPASLSFINTSTASGPPDLQVMRYGLGTTLLNNGVYIHDRGAFAQNESGPAWWFDEYSNGAGSALTGATNTTQTTVSVVNGNRFNLGDTIWVDREAMLVVGRTETSLKVVRAANGTVPIAHDKHSVVATLAQIKAGLGYLGNAQGDPYMVGTRGTSILSNGTFSSKSLSGWKTSSTAPASLQESIDTDTSQADAASAKVAVTSIDGFDSHSSLGQDALVLKGGTTYVLSYWSKAGDDHTVHVTLCSSSLPSGKRCMVDFYKPVTASGWTKTEVLFVAPKSVTNASLRFNVGDMVTTTWIDSVSLQTSSNPVMRRDFSQGTVLVNTTDTAYTASLGAGYCHLQGDQNPKLNSGAAVTSVSMPAKDAVILRTCQPTNLANNGTFESSISPWTMRVAGSAQATIGLDSATASDGNRSLRVSVATASSSGHHVQVKQEGLALVANRTYTVSFAAKSDRMRTAQVVLQQRTSPNTLYFLSNVQLTTAWKTYTFTVTPKASQSNAFIGFNLAQTTGTIWLDSVIIR